MAPQYGEVRVDYITYTTGVVPNEGTATAYVSGLINNPTFSGNVIIEGDATIDGNLNVSGDINASGVVISGITGLFDAGTEALPSIAFALDPNTGIYNPSANEVGISTGGGERLRVDNTGNVGIGTDNPQAKLQIRKDIAGAEGANLLLTNDNNAANSSVGLYFSPNEADGASRAASITSSNTSLGATRADLRFTTANGDTPQERMRILSTGNVGIGTTSPSETLEVAGNTILDASNATLKIKQGVTGTTGAIDFTLNSDSTSYGSLNLVYDDRITQGLRLNTTYPLTLECGASEEILFKRTTTESARIDSSGRLLVGTNDGTDFVPGATIQGFVDGTPGANDMPGRLVFSTTADGASTPTERMRISEGRTDAFGTSETLRVRTAATTAAASIAIRLQAGATSITAGGTTEFQVTSNGNVANTTNSYGAISDIKLKENIVDANSQWNDLKALQVRNYNFKEGQTHTQIGLVAQEAELVSPGLVNESPDHDAEGNDLGTVTKSVNYSVLYMKAVKALQEAMERIETFEQRLSDAGIA
jgi:hypothetical protein